MSIPHVLVITCTSANTGSIFCNMLWHTLSLVIALVMHNRMHGAQDYHHTSAVLITGIIFHACLVHSSLSTSTLLDEFTANFSERLSTFTYSFQESCSLYPRCTPYFSVEHTVSPQSVVSNTSSGCSVEYTILNLTRCRSYHSTATALLGNQRGNTVIVGDTVMLSEWGMRRAKIKD